MWIYTGKKLAKFYGNILNLSENIAKSFMGAIFWLTLYIIFHRTIHLLVFLQYAVSSRFEITPTGAWNKLQERQV